MASLGAVWMRPLRRIVGAHRQPAPGDSRQSNVEVRRKLAAPPTAAALTAGRLRYAARVPASASDYLMALIQFQAGGPWRTELAKDMEKLQAALASKLDGLGSPAAQPAAWEEFWRTWPQQWAALSRHFLQAASRTQDCNGEGRCADGAASYGE